MGHNVATHLKHYGSWTDEASLEAAVERFNAGVPAGVSTQVTQGAAGPLWFCYCYRVRTALG